MSEQAPPPEPNLIEIRVGKLAQLFHDLDPYPFREKDLDKDAEEFIVSWARELPRDRPFKIVVHMPEEQLALPEAQDVRPAVKQFFAYRAQVMTLELKELFRIGRRSLAIGFTVLFLSVLAGQTIARKIEPRALGKVIEESSSYSPGWRIGARSKSFSTIGGRSSAGATSIAGWGRPKWSSGLTGRAMSGAKSCPRNEGGCWRRRWSGRPSRQMPGGQGAARPIFGRPGKPA